MTKRESKKAESTFKSKVTAKVSIQNLREEVFLDMTPLEMLIVLNKMQEDLLCSDISEDTLYRNEIVYFSKAVTKMIIALKNNLNPKNINVIELICADS